MNPLFFGDGNAPVYGVYHPPLVAPRPEGVVLCYPFGQEYMRAHRAYRQLSLLLARKGFHVLRFDYRGTGDSSGEMEQVVAADWLMDVEEAVRELRDMAGVSRVSVAGLRLGALIAAEACRRIGDVDGLMIWDPVVSGAEYCRELEAEITAAIPSEYSAPPGNLLQADGSILFNGFTMPAQFRNSIEQLDFTSAVPLPVRQLLLVVSHETEAFAGIRDGWTTHPDFRYLHVPAPHDWNFVDDYGGILLPQPVIRGMVNWMDVREAR